MNGLYLFFALLLGVPCGVGLALFVVSNALDSSNNFGDSKSAVRDVAKGGFIYKNSKDRVSRNEPLDPVRHPVILEKRGVKPPVTKMFGVDNK